MSSKANSTTSSAQPTEQQIQRVIEATMAYFEEEDFIEGELDYEPEQHGYACPCCKQPRVEWNEASQLYSCSDCGLITKGSF